MSLEAYAGGPVTAKMTNGQVMQFERVTPSILVELGSYHRALTGKGQGWLTLDDCMALVTTVEGMRWLCWRCAVKYQPEYAGDAGREKFKPLLEDFNLLTGLASELTTFPESEADPTVPAPTPATG